MPNLVPGVRWEPIDHRGIPKRHKGRGLCGHVAVSSADALRPSGGNTWHFYLPRQGTPIQYVDLDYCSAATFEGNSTMAAFESEGGLGPSSQLNAEPWTDNQLDWAARILLYLHRTEGVPLRVMASSRSGERGFATHRLGINPWRVADGELWSRFNGKECPGTRKHEQRFEVVRRAQAMADGEDDDVTDADIDKIAKKVMAWPLEGGIGNTRRALEKVKTLETDVAEVNGKLDQILALLQQPPA